MQIDNGNLPAQLRMGLISTLCEFDQKFRNIGLDAHLVFTLYDEIVVEARAAQANAMKNIMDDCLTLAFKDIIPEMPF